MKCQHQFLLHGERQKDIETGGEADKPTDNQDVTLDSARGRKDGQHRANRAEQNADPQSPEVSETPDQYSNSGKYFCQWRSGKMPDQCCIRIRWERPERKETQRSIRLESELILGASNTMLV